MALWEGPRGRARETRFGAKMKLIVVAPHYPRHVRRERSAICRYAGYSRGPAWPAWPATSACVRWLAPGALSLITNGGQGGKKGGLGGGLAYAEATISGLPRCSCCSPREKGRKWRWARGGKGQARAREALSHAGCARQRTCRGRRNEERMSARRRGLLPAFSSYLCCLVLTDSRSSSDMTPLPSSSALLSLLADDGRRCCPPAACLALARNVSTLFGVATTTEEREDSVPQY